MAFFTILCPRKDRRRYASVEAERLGHGGVEHVAQVVENETAGDPMRDNVKWTHHTLASLSEALGKQGSPVGADAVKQLLSRRVGFFDAKGEHVEGSVSFATDAVVLLEVARRNAGKSGVAIFAQSNVYKRYEYSLWSYHIERRITRKRAGNRVASVKLRPFGFGFALLGRSRSAAAV